MNALDVFSIVVRDRSSLKESMSPTVLQTDFISPYLDSVCLDIRSKCGTSLEKGQIGQR